VALAGFIVPLYGWLLWNELFTVREARRLFWFIGLGGLFGAAMGGLFSGLSVSVFGTKGLLPMAILYLLGGLLVMRRLKILHPEAWERDSSILLKQPLRESRFKLLLGSKALLLILAVILLTEFSSTWIEFLFQSATQKNFSSEDSMAHFFGLFYAGTSGVGLVIQLFATRLMIARMGLRWSMLILPLFLALFSVGFFVIPGLVAVAFARGIDSSLRHSLQRTSLEILYFPIPESLKKILRGTFEVLSQRAGMALAGVVIFTLLSIIPTGGVGFYVPLWVSLVTLIILSKKLQASYIQGLQSSFKSLRARKITDSFHSFSDMDFKNMLNQALRSREESVVLHSLEIVDVLDLRDLLPTEFTKHVSPQVKVKVLQLCRLWKVHVPRQTIRLLLNDPVAEVRAEALALAGPMRRVDIQQLIEPHLSSSNPMMRAHVAAYFSIGKDPLRQKASRVLEEMCRSHVPLVREEVAKVVTSLDTEKANLFLNHLLKDSDQKVLACAIQSAGKLRSREHLPRLVELLSDSRFRSVTEDALVMCGEPILEYLEEIIKDPAINLKIRHAIPSVVRRIPGQKSINILLKHLGTEEIRFRYKIIKSLNRLRRDQEILPIRGDPVRQTVVLECHWYRHLLKDWKSLRNLGSSESSTKLLLDHLQDHQLWTIERIFRLLGLLKRQKDIHRAYLGYSSESKRTKANAMEFLDNILDRDIRGIVLPILEKRSGPNDQEPYSEIGRPLDTLLELLRHPDRTAVSLSWETLRVHYPQILSGLSLSGGPWSRFIGENAGLSK